MLKRRLKSPRDSEKVAGQGKVVGEIVVLAERTIGGARGRCGGDVRRLIRGIVGLMKTCNVQGVRDEGCLGEGLLLAFSGDGCLEVAQQESREWRLLTQAFTIKA